MRVLVVSPFLPHADAAHGGGEYLAALVGALAERVELGLVAFATPAELAHGLHPVGPFAHTEIVTLPRRDDLSGLARLRARARWFGRWLFGGVPLTVAKFESAAMRRALSHAVERFDPDVCLVEFGLMAQYLPQLRGTLRVLTDHEAGNPVPVRVGPFGLGAARDRRLWKRWVDATYTHAELLQALNREDAAALGARFARPVAIRRATTELPEIAVCPGAAPPRALFMGDFSHYPNPEAARFVVAEVWPRLRTRCPDAELWITGRNIDPALGVELERAAGVSVRGFVADRTELLASVRLLLAPVLSGSGSRIKVLTALAHGLPVVTNRLGARGIDAPVGMRVVDGASELAEAAMDWLLLPANAEAAGRDARSWAELELSPAAVADRQVAELTELRSRAVNSPRP